MEYKGLSSPRSEMPFELSDRSVKGTRRSTSRGNAVTTGVCKTAKDHSTWHGRGVERTQTEASWMPHGRGERGCDTGLQFAFSLAHFC